MTEEAANDQSGHRSKNATPSGRVVTARQTKLDLNIFPGRIVFSISESTRLHDPSSQKVPNTINIARIDQPPYWVLETDDPKS